MKRIGLIGGVGWASSMEYYKRLNQKVWNKQGGVVCADLVMRSLNFEDILKFQESNDVDSEVDVLKEALRLLESAGCEVLAICSATTSKNLPLLRPSVRVPLISVVDVVRDHVAANNLKTLGLLATKHTLSNKVFHDALDGVTLITPTGPDVDIVHDVIYDELIHNVTTAESLTALSSLKTGLELQGSEKVILGCTELGQAFAGDDSVIDIVELHCDAILEAAF